MRVHVYRGNYQGVSRYSCDRLYELFSERYDDVHYVDDLDLACDFAVFPGGMGSVWRHCFGNRFHEVTDFIKSGGCGLFICCGTYMFATESMRFGTPWVPGTPQVTKENEEYTHPWGALKGGRFFGPVAAKQYLYYVHPVRSVTNFNAVMALGGYFSKVPEGTIILAESEIEGEWLPTAVDISLGKGRMICSAFHFEYGSGSFEIYEQAMSTKPNAIKQPDKDIWAALLETRKERELFINHVIRINSSVSRRGE